MQARDDRAGPWPDLFARLARLETLQPTTREFDTEFNALKTVADQRERAGLKAKNSVEKFRARTLRFHLQRLGNLPGEQATEPDVILDWLPFEAWYATRALRPGMYRVVTAVAALDDTERPDPTRSSWALRLYEEERAKLDYDLAERLAVGLYRRDPSAANVERLAHVHVTRGNKDAALSVLGEALAALSASEGADLAGDRAAHSARLHTARARTADALLLARSALADYGAALAFGSVEAARDQADAALSRGQQEKARFLADIVLQSSPSDPEARIQRALSQLPPTKPLQHRTPGPRENATLDVDTAARGNHAPSGN